MSRGSRRRRRSGLVDEPLVGDVRRVQVEGVVPCTLKAVQRAEMERGFVSMTGRLRNGDEPTWGRV